MVVDHPNSPKTPAIGLSARSCKKWVAKLARLSCQFVINIDFRQVKSNVLARFIFWRNVVSPVVLFWANFFQCFVKKDVLRVKTTISTRRS